MRISSVATEIGIGFPVGHQGTGQTIITPEYRAKQAERGRRGG